MTWILIFTCISTPLFISFHKNNYDEWDSWEITNICVDIFFGFDIIVVFLSAFYDDDFRMIDNVKEIARAYLFGWFIIDLLAIIPFDQL